MGVYKRGDTWYISYFLNGRHIREAMGANKAAAEAVLNRKKLAIRAGKYSDPEDLPRITIDMACDEYKKRSAHLKSQSTLKYALAIIKKHFAGRNVCDLTEKDIDDFIITRRDAPTRWKTKRAGATVNREVNILRSLLTMATRQGMMEKNPASRPRRLPESKGRLRYLTTEEAGRLLELAKKTASKDIYTIILIALESGLRRGEIFNLHWADLDFRNDQVWVRETKNGAPRYVPMTARVKETLSKRPRRLGMPYIFPGRTEGNHLSNGVRETFMNLLERAGIKDFRFHDLRHTFASHLVMAGVPLHTVGQLLGHKTPGMTMRYSHLSPDHLKQAVRNLPAWGTSTKLAQAASGEAENA
jgi:integrase